MNKDIVIYSKDYCPYCKQAKALFISKGIAFTEHDIFDDAALTAQMIERSAGRRTVPQIFIGDVHVGGASDLFDLESQGLLDSMLESTGKQPA